MLAEVTLWCNVETMLFLTNGARLFGFLSRNSYSLLSPFTNQFWVNYRLRYAKVKQRLLEKNWTIFLLTQVDKVFLNRIQSVLIIKH